MERRQIEAKLREIRPGSGDRELVAVMNNPRDLARAREEGWYRIPLRHAPKRLGADYLAFYLTAAFPEDERWQVRYYAPIRAYRLVTRRELIPEEPDHPRADELYYKIEIGPLTILPRPIPSRRLRRITFIPTTLEKLLHAEEINALWDRGRHEDLLWQALQDEGVEAERQWEIRERKKLYCLDFACWNGIQQAGLVIDRSPPQIEGWAILHCTREDLLLEPHVWAKRIKALLTSPPGQA